MVEPYGVADYVEWKPAISIRTYGTCRHTVITALHSDATRETHNLRIPPNVQKAVSGLPLSMLMSRPTDFLPIERRYVRLGYEPRYALSMSS